MNFMISHPAFTEIADIADIVPAEARRYGTAWRWRMGGYALMLLSSVISVFVYWKLCVAVSALLSSVLA